VDDARFARLLQPQRHVAADQVHLAPHERVDVGVHGLRVGRHEDARAVVAHLVLVDPHLRLPFVVHRVRHADGFLLRDHEPISVEWMLHVTSTNDLPSLTRAFTPASESPRGSESFFAISFKRGRFLMFASDEITAMIMSSPSVVLPKFSTSIRGESLSSSAK